MTPKKKLIEIALPLEAINKASAREKSIRHGHPSTLHLWWARRPLAAARAVIFAQMVDDPSNYPDLFPTEKAQERERQRLFKIIEDLVQWENTTNEEVLQRAREEIWQSWRRACAENADHPRAKELFNRYKLPAFHDPFAGGGALPLEAQRLGLEAYASDLNPVAVLINKAMIEIPPKFAGLPPVNPESRKKEIGNRGLAHGTVLQGTRGLAEGHGGGEGSLSPSAEAATGGNLRYALPDHPRSGLGSGEHRRGLGEGIRQGEGAISGCSSGLISGSGDTFDALPTDRLVSIGRDSASAEFARGGGEDVDDDAKKQKGVESRKKEIRDRADADSTTSSLLFPNSYIGAQGLAEDVRYYGKWMRDEAEKRIGHLYPKIEITAEMAKERPDLKPYVGKKLTVIAWLWARTVKSPNPAFANVDVPLASTFMLSTKAGKEAYIEPVFELPSPSGRGAGGEGGYRFTVKVGKPKDAEAAKNGTKLSRGANFSCLMSGTPIAPNYIKAEGMAGRMDARLMAIVAEGDHGRVYLPPTSDHDAVARKAKPEWEPEPEIAPDRRSMFTPLYGMTHFRHLFTPRQLVALTTFSDLVQEARERVRKDAISAGLPDDGKPLADGGTGASAYADAVGVYLAFAMSRISQYWSNITSWHNKGEKLQPVFGRQAIPMVWDFSEGNPLSESTGNFQGSVDWIEKSFQVFSCNAGGSALPADASQQIHSTGRLVSTDPPYYDNIGYADLSDFFYVWLRRSLKSVFPDLFATLAVPKAEELVATPYRHGSKEKAEAFFLDGMTQAMHRLAEQAHPAFPVTIYYAFKQSESDGNDGTSSTGWETFLDAVIRAGFAISGTWPVRTEMKGRVLERGGTNALASSIILVCRKRAADAPTATRRDFVNTLKAELPKALINLQKGNIAPVDLAQAAIGPGMAVYTRYSKVLDAEGKPVSVREALSLINQTLDEALAEQEGDFDADSRWALAWFEQYGFAEGEFGVAETLSKAKNTSVSGMVEAGILASKGGKVRLLKPSELPANWDPSTDPRLTAWEMVHHLIRVLEAGGESAAAALVAKIGSKAEVARELAYRLYTQCERKKRAAEALSYNALVQSWPEIVRLAREAGRTQPAQASLFEEVEE